MNILKNVRAGNKDEWYKKYKHQQICDCKKNSRKKSRYNWDGLDM